MTEAVGHLLTVSSIVQRLENHLENIRSEYESTPWWKWRRRLILSGSISTYRYEIEQILEISASWQPIWNKLARQNGQPPGRIEEQNGKKR